MRSALFTLLAIVGVLVPAGSGQTSTLVIPNGLTAVAGNTQTDLPQNTAADQVWQWHYDASNFGALGPITITDLAIRPKPGQGIASFNFSEWEVTLIESRSDWTVAAHNPLFGGNILRSARVRSGPWTGGPTLPILPATVGGFFSMGLTGSFTYDPSTGNDFIVQIRKTGTNLPWGTALDAASGASNPSGGNRYGHTTDASAQTDNFNNTDFIPVIRVTYRPATQTIPFGYDTIDGNGSPAFPFNTTADQKWQWHYDSGQFPVGGPIAIKELWVRPFSAGAVLPAFSLPSLKITLGPATTDWEFQHHIAPFAGNIERQEVVRTGVFAGGPYGPAAGATGDWIPLGLSHDVVYDPSSGQDFIVQLEKCGSTTPWAIGMDGVTGPNGTVGGNRYGHTSDCSAAMLSLNPTPNDIVPILRVDYESLSAGAGAVTTYPYREDFDHLQPGTILPKGWENVRGEAPDEPGDWIVQALPTSTAGTGPAADHTSGAGKYVYVEDSGSDNAIVAMLTPTFDLTGLAQPRLSFWAHSENAGGGVSVLSINVFRLPNGPFADAVGGVIGIIGPLWTEQTIDLSPWIGETIRIQFAVDNDNGDFAHDIAIDDVRIYENSTPFGQAPTIFAALDANFARNALGQAVTLGTPGPYFADYFAHELLGLRVEGLPNQAVVLVSGPLAVASSTFPGIGQLDLDVNQLVVIVDGVNGAGLMPGVQITDGSGAFNIPGPFNLPAGLFLPLQAAVFTGGPSVAALSNALVIVTL